MVGLETTATLDKNTDEFVIHTPTIRATKFWPGSMGVMANYAVVYARCIANGNDYGVQPFMVPIRDMKTHLALPGVKVGDIGEKLGFNSVDNGWLAFDHFRIPRDHMLSRFAEVDKEGNFSLKGDPRTIYQIMVSTRIYLLFGSAGAYMQANLIAARYAACRR